MNIKVSYGSDQHDVAVPSNSTFGDLKLVILQRLGLNPETHKLLFRGKEKEDDENLQTAGVKDNSKVIIMEDTFCTRESVEEVKESSVISRGVEAVAQVREEVDKLSDQISALQSVVDSGTKVDGKDIIYLTEMLMRQLLKLDGIEAEGEGKVQRKLEVRRVQSFVEIMDKLKARNSNPLTNGNDAVPVTTEWVTFEPIGGSPNVASPMPASNSNPFPSPTPTSMPYSAACISPVPSTHYSTATATPIVSMPHFSPTPFPATIHAVPYSNPSVGHMMQYSSPVHNSSVGHMMQYSSPVHNSSIPYSSLAPNVIPAPSVPYSTSSATPAPHSFPLPFPSVASSPMPPSTTHDWEHFD